MRVLWVKVGGLWPLHTGGRLRSFHIVSELSRRHRVILATTDTIGDDPDGLAAALSQCEQVVSVGHVPPKRGSGAFGRAALRSALSPFPVHFWGWRVPALRRYVREILAAGGVDICVADFLHTMPNVGHPGAVPVVLFAHNVEHMIWKRLRQVDTSAWRRAVLELEWRKIRWWEARACTDARLTIAVSESDRNMLAAIAPSADVRAIPTGVDPEYFTPDNAREAPAQLVFTGSMDWYPNEDAVLHFLNAIFPAIRREVPEASLTIVGRNPSERMRRLADRAGVRVTGTVEDVRPYIARAAVYVVPLRIGGGTRLKIFEALAMGKAVVSTQIGAEGLPLIPGEHFLREDNPAQFAQAVVSLLRDSTRRKALGAAGRRLIEQRFSWSCVTREFETLCQEAATPAPQRGDGTNQGRVRSCV